MSPLVRLARNSPKSNEQVTYCGSFFSANIRPAQLKPGVLLLKSVNRFRFHSVFPPSLTSRADRKSQVSQYLGFCTADFLSSLAYELDV